MKQKVYTIEYGLFYLNGDKIFQECKNQPSFLDIDKANEELANYLRWSNLFFDKDKNFKKYQEDGYYIELYENEVELDDEEIRLIEEEYDYPDGTSLSIPIREILVDNTGKIVHYKNDNSEE